MTDKVSIALAVFIVLGVFVIACLSVVLFAWCCCGKLASRLVPTLEYKSMFKPLAAAVPVVPGVPVIPTSTTPTPHGVTKVTSPEQQDELDKLDVLQAKITVVNAILLESGVQIKSADGEGEGIVHVLLRLENEVDVIKNTVREEKRSTLHNSELGFRLGRSITARRAVMSDLYKCIACLYSGLVEKSERLYYQVRGANLTEDVKKSVEKIHEEKIEKAMSDFTPFMGRYMTAEGKEVSDVVEITFEDLEYMHICIGTLHSGCEKIKKLAGIKEYKSQPPTYEEVFPLGSSTSPSPSAPLPLPSQQQHSLSSSSLPPAYSPSAATHPPLPTQISSSSLLPESSAASPAESLSRSSTHSEEFELLEPLAASPLISLST